MTRKIRTVLPTPLRALAGAPAELELDCETPVCQRSLLDALERAYPSLRGTLRDQTTHLRRPFIRFFACGEDLSHESAEEPLPPTVANGTEPFLIIGAIAGG